MLARRVCWGTHSTELLERQKPRALVGPSRFKLFILAVTTSFTALRGAKLCGSASGFAHTHLVRGGFLMLEPTRRRRTAEPGAYPPRQRWVPDARAYWETPHGRTRRIPTSSEVGP